MIDFMKNLFGNGGLLFGADGWKMLLMWLIGGTLIYLAIAKDMEPGLMLPLGFGAILVNLPRSGAFSEILSGVAPTSETGTLTILYKVGIENELFPLLLFIGIGAMIDFGPLLSNPKLMVFGAASQFGIFFTFAIASLAGFQVRDAASIAIIGAADGPTSIAVGQAFQTQYLGAIMVAAYSYMALVPIIQPPVIKALTSRNERLIRMPYKERSVSKLTRILFPIIITVVAGIVSPKSVALVGFLMFGNLLRECGVLNSLSETAQNAMTNIITILLGISIAPSLHYTKFVTWQTAMILGLGLIAFIFDTVGGVLLAKLFNVFLKEGNKINPMIGGTGISAFPMSARVIHKMGLAEDPQNFLLMHTIGVNVSGQISSVIAGGLILTLIPQLFPAL